MQLSRPCSGVRKMSHRRVQLPLTPLFGWLSELTSFPIHTVRPSRLSWRPSRLSGSRCFPNGWALLGSGLALLFLAAAAQGVGAPLAWVVLGRLGTRPNRTPHPRLGWFGGKKSVWIRGHVLGHMHPEPPLGPGQAVCNVEIGAGGDIRRN